VLRHVADTIGVRISDTLGEFEIAQGRQHRGLLATVNLDNGGESIALAYATAGIAQLISNVRFAKDASLGPDAVAISSQIIFLT
jgi:hypothetical protein